jgi:hypothetical protein
MVLSKTVFNLKITDRFVLCTSSLNVNLFHHPTMGVWQGVVIELPRVLLGPAVPYPHALRVTTRKAGGLRPSSTPRRSRRTPQSSFWSFYPSQTFDNTPLLPAGDFTCRLVEVVGFGARYDPG